MEILWPTRTSLALEVGATGTRSHPRLIFLLVNIRYDSPQMEEAASTLTGSSRPESPVPNVILNRACAGLESLQV
jgi:hypothetical protein